MSKLRFYDLDNKVSFSYAKADISPKKDEKAEPTKISIINVIKELPSILKEYDVKERESMNSFKCKERSENLHYEFSRENQRKILDKAIASIKTEKHNLKKVLFSIDRDIQSLELEIDVLVNYNKYHDYVQEKKKKMGEFAVVFQTDNSRGSSSGRKKSNRKNEKELEKFVMEFQKAEDEREILKNNKIVELEGKKLQQKRLREKYSDLSTLLQKKLTQLEGITYDLLTHYHRLLLEGKDTR